MLRVFAPLAVSGVLAFTAGIGAAQQLRVDLRAAQTPIRNQLNQDTCTHFAAIAAIEAAYLRAGRRVDLSESFARSAIKTMWLSTWQNVATGGAGMTENQLSYAGGGTATQTLRLLSEQIRVPQERSFPYRSRHTVLDDPRVANRWNSAFWTSQRNMNDFNLTSGIWPRSALEAGRYYAGTGYTDIPVGRNMNTALRAIEQQLAIGREVTVGLSQGQGPVRQPGGTNTIIMDACVMCPPAGHAMLLVGYDRTARDPAQHYFIAKNSWGPASAGTRPDGFTYLSYGFLRAHLLEAGYITGVRTPSDWPEVGFVGRWAMSYDGHAGTLDINRVPGVMTRIVQRRDGMADRRLGTFTTASGTMFRVNGSLNGDRIRFYIDTRNPNADYDDRGGRVFDYWLSEDKTFATGAHKDPDGRIYGGFMVRSDAVGVPIPAKVQARGWSTAAGIWDVYSWSGARVHQVPLAYDARTTLPSVMSGRVTYDTIPQSHAAGRALRMKRGNLDIGQFHRLNWHGNIATGWMNLGDVATLVPVIYIKQ